MTTLGSAVDATPAASPLVAPCVRRLGGAFSPALCDSMSDDGVVGGGGGGGGGGCRGGTSSSSSGNVGLNDGNGRWKRELEPGGCEEQQPPPAKRVSPILRRPHNTVVTTATGGGGVAAAAVAAAAAAAATAATAQYLGDAAAATPIAPAPLARPWPSSPICSLGNNTGGCTHAQARENALAVCRAPSSSPSKVTAAKAGAAAASPARTAASAKPNRLSTLGTDRPRSPPPLSGKPAVSKASSVSGEHAPQQHPRLNSSSSAPSPLTMFGHSRHFRDILKPSASKQKTGDVVGGPQGDDGASGTLGWGSSDGDSPGKNSCKSMKRPLGGGVRAPTMWDGGSASNGPPGSGGGLSAPPVVCASCEGREPCSCSGKGGTLRPSSMPSCPSPLPFARSISSDSSVAGGGGGSHLGRNLFSDNPLSCPINGLHSSLGVGPPLAESSRSLSVGGGGGGGGGHVEVDDFAMLLENDDNTHDIHACMRTLQASPAHGGSTNHPHHSDQVPAGFYISSLDEAHDNNVNGEGGVMDVDNAAGIHPSSNNGGNDVNTLEQGDSNVVTSAGVSAADGYGEGVGPKIGENHQAVIPDLAVQADDGTPIRSSRRPLPLQLWRPGVLSQTALGLAFPPPREDGEGSADLEQKMLQAFLVAKASESKLICGVDGSGSVRPQAHVSEGSPRGPATTMTASAPRPEGAGKGLLRPAAAGATAGDYSDDIARTESTNSLEDLAAFVASGLGGRRRSDWLAEDRAAFRKGIFAFRRDFHRVRAKFLPNKAYGDVVDYFYRRWKRDPEYPAWKCTNQLVGRRVAKRVETTHLREGAGPAKRFEMMGLRRGWVVQKKDMLLDGGDEDMFVIRYPRMGALPVKLEMVDLGTLETMLVEGSASDEDREEEGLDRGGRPGGIGGGSGAWHLPYDMSTTSVDDGGGAGGSGGGGSQHSDLPPMLSAGHHGPLGGQQRLGQQSALRSEGGDGDGSKEEEEDERGVREEDSAHRRVWSEGEEEDDDEDDEDENETEDAEADEGDERTSDSGSGCGQDDETDSSGPSTS